MTITQYKTRKVETATSEGNLNNRYTLIITAWSDDRDDDAAYVAWYFRNNGYGIGTTYSQPNYEDPLAVVKRIEPRFVKDSYDPWIWEVRIEYEPPTFVEPNPDEDGIPNDDPTFWRWEFDVFQTPRSVPVWAAWNEDAYPRPPAPSHDVPTRPAGTLGPVMASDGTILDPPLMRTVKDTTYRISGNWWQFRPEYITSIIDTINLLPIRFHPAFAASYHALPVEFEVYELLCTVARAKFRFENNTKFWQYTYEFLYRPRTAGLFADPAVDDYKPLYKGDGHLEQVLDRGLSRITTTGAPDGQGNQVVSAPTGSSPRSPILTHDGKRTPEISLLDGRGEVLDVDDSWHDTGVWFRYRIHDAVDWVTQFTLPLHFFADVP